MLFNTEASTPHTLQNCQSPLLLEHTLPGDDPLDGFKDVCNDSRYGGPAQ